MGSCCSGRNQQLTNDNSYSPDKYQSNYSENDSKDDEVIKTPSQSNGVRPHHKVVVVGKVAAGKSTSINMFVNLAYQRKYKDPRKIAITQKLAAGLKNEILRCNMPEFNNKQSDSLNSDSYESQTSKVSIYEIKGKDYDISLIDTPGIDNGTNKDKENFRNIVAQIQKLSKITCILYIHRASDIRECSFLNFYINQLKDLLPVECQDNIVIGFTGNENPFKIEAMPVLKKQGIIFDKYVCFENDCLIPPDYFSKSDFSQSYEKISQIQWKRNTEQFEKFIQMQEPVKLQDPNKILDLFCKKQAITKMIYETQHKIEEIQQIKMLHNEVIANIVNVKQTLQQYNNQSSVRLVWQTKTKKQSIKKYIDVELKEKVTFCYQCCRVCHNPCKLQEIYNKGDVKIKKCYAFGCGSCSKCKRCSHAPQLHGHSMKIQQVVDKEEDIEYETIEQQSSQYASQTTIRNEITQAINQLTIKENNIRLLLEQKEEELKEDMILIAFLSQQIEDQSMNFNNQIIIEYIEEKIQITYDDPYLEQNQKNYQLSELRKQQDYYKNPMYNQPQLERQIQQLLDEETRIIMSRDFS